MTTQTLDRPLPRTGRPWWTVPALVVALLVVALLAYGLWASDRAQPSDGPVPDFALQTFDGQTIATSELRGSPIVINFWASWCRECDEEMAVLQGAHERYGPEVVFLGVDYTDTDAKARAYLAQYGITYANGPDLGGRISDAFGVRLVPETFFVDRDGIVRGHHVGPLDEAALEGWLQTLRSE